jgi:tetratricopeptide (TPR) repeat protein
MLNYSSEISKPKGAEDFEEFCLIVYRVVFGDPTATKNGRSGQKQNGVDIFVQRNEKRVGVQCKRVTLGELNEEIIDAEVAAADAGKVPITELIVATTAPNDTKLISYAHKLSDKRKANGLFTVSLAFWDTLESYVRQHGELQYQFAPNAPGGAFYKASQERAELLDWTKKTYAAVTSASPISQGELPEARHDSLNRVITSQLDDIRKLILAGKFQDALDRLSTIGSSFASFDSHQKFRWHSQRAVCYWRSGDKKQAVIEFEHGVELEPNDDKAAANYTRASLLRDRPDEAVTRADAAVKRFPSSPSVWAAWANAHYGAGDPINIDSVPPEVRGSDEVLHTFAWINLRQRNSEEAARLSSEAYRVAPESFDARSLFLACTLARVTSNPIRAGLGIPTPEDRALLERAIQSFAPFREKLWIVQDSEALTQAIVHLSYALLITGRERDAHDLLREAVDEFPRVKYLNRAFIECLQRQDRADDAYEFGLGRVEDLDEPGLAMLAELAANRGDIKTVEAIQSKIDPHSEYARLKDDIEGLHWLALWRNNRTDDLITAFAANNIGQQTNMTMLSVAARILNRIPEKKTESKELLARIKSLIGHDAIAGDVLQAADACLACSDFDAAATLFERIVPTEGFSELHEKLLYAFIKSGQRRKAFALIKSAPPGSLFSENFRHMAIELAQAANDWQELRNLSELELHHNAARADAWLFRAVVYLNEREFEPLRKLLADAPIELQGRPRSVGGLASLDLRFGDAEKGMARLYRRFRQDLGDTEAATVYFGLSASAPSRFFAESIGSVSAGTSVVLRVDGEQRRLTIDPPAAGVVPSHPEFVESGNEIAQQLIGRSVGERVSVKESFGFVRQYEIAEVQSAYIALGRRAADLIHTSVKPVKGLLSVPIPKDTDGKPDFRHVLEQLKANSDRIRAGIEAYGEGKLTIGLLASMLGTTTVILSNDWPAKPAPSLYVWSGKPDEQTVARQLVKERPKPAVIDLLTLTELVMCECEATLEPLAPVFIPQSNVGALAQMVEDAEADVSSGSLREQAGQMIYMETTADSKKRKIEILQKIQKCVSKYCKPSAAYGPETLPEGIREIGRLLDDESLDPILLALEHQAILITLDGRLREYANNIAKVPGVWPQVVLAYSLEKKAISPSAYYYAVIRQLCTRRTHVAVGPHDMRWLLEQGDALLQEGMRAIKEHLSDSRVEPISAFGVVADVIQRMPSTAAQLGAIGEVTEHLLAAIFLHPNLNRENAIAIAEYFVRQAVDRLFQSDIDNYFERDHAIRRHLAWREYLTGAVRRAGEAAAHPIDDLLAKTLQVRNLFCTRNPLLVLTAPRTVH